MAQGATAAIPAVGRSWLDKAVWLLPFLWGSGLAFLWRGFTFFWDEWNVLAASLDHPARSVLQENGGNFFPLSRLVFTLEAHIFQENYWAYIFVTSTLFGFVAVAFTKWILRPNARIEVLFAWLLGISYLLAAGVLFASAMGFMLKWALAPLFAVLAVYFYDRNQTRLGRLLGAGGCLLVSALAFSSAVIIMGAFVAGAIMRTAQDRSQIRRTAIDAVSLLGLSGLLGVAGAAAATLFPADDASVTGDPLSGLDLTSPLGVVTEAWAATVSSVVATTTVVPLTNLDLWVTLVLFVAGNLGVLALLTAVVVGAVFISRRRTALISVLASIAVIFAFLIVLKDPIIVRYQALWALPAMLAVWLIVTQSIASRVLTGARILVAAWMVVALAFSVTWIPRAGSLERDRYAVDSERLYSKATCIEEATMHSEEISPSASPEYVCAIVDVLVGRG